MPLLYRSKQRWLIVAAFAASILIHLAAVLAAQVRDTTEAVTATLDPGPVIAELDPAPSDPPQPADAIPPLPPPPDMDLAIPEDHAPPPSPQHAEKPARPIARPAWQGTSGDLSMRAARADAIDAPRPIYPYEARRQHTTGSGVAILTVDGSGAVTDVTMSPGTGSAILDAATVSAFRRWRFKPGSVAHVRTPITFTLVGAEF